MNSLRIVLFVAIGLGATAPAASAWALIDVTASEVLSVDPPRVRTTFELTYSGYNPPGYSGDYFEVAPLDPASLHIYDCSASAAWVCGEALPLPDGGRYFGHQGGPFDFPATFSIVTDQATPCVRFQWFSIFPIKTPTPSLNYAYEMCLLVDAPVPTAAKTWGSLKAHYR